MGDKRATAKVVQQKHPACPFCGEETAVVYLVPPGTMKRLRTGNWCKHCEIGWRTKKGAKPPR